MKLLKPLYGLPDSEDRWGGILNNYMRQDLNIQSCPSGEALFSKFERNVLHGICVTHVDDTLQAGSNDSFQLFENKTNLSTYESRIRPYSVCRTRCMQ